MIESTVIPLLVGFLALPTASASPPAGVLAVTVPAPAAEGAAKEVAVLADLPAVKIVAITLRAGTALPDHSASAPVTIEAAHGSATVTVAGVATAISPGTLVVLDANTVHAVTPVGASPVTVLVHHHLQGAK